MLPEGFIKKLDKTALFAMASLVCAGLLVLYTSSSAQGVEGRGLFFFYHQLIWLGIAVAVGVLLMALDYRIWARISLIAYIANIALLVALLIIGKATRGAESWFSVGLFNVQPSEAAKVLFIITFATFLADSRDSLNSNRKLGLAALQFAAPFGLIVLQPDMGTALVYAALFFGMLFVAGMDSLKMLVSGAALVSAGVIAAPVFIKGYQWERLTAFLNPSQDIAGAGWQLHQSIVAIGSGGLTGRGFFNGTQAALGYLPEAHTDFIFSAFCEQTGLIGGTALIFVICLLLYRIMRIALSAEDLFATYIAAGVFCMIAFETAVNLGMSVGLLPITGLPLPFVSYGGSSLITHFAAMGLVFNINIRRKKITFE